MTLAKQAALNKNFRPKGKNILDKVLSLQSLQRETSPYGSPDADANKFLFGNDHRVLAEKFAKQGKMAGEIGEFYAHALDPNAKKEDLSDEFGDVLWQVINIGLQYGIEIKDALEKALHKRLKRLGKVVGYANNAGLKISQTMPIETWLNFWNQAKNEL